MHPALILIEIFLPRSFEYGCFAYMFAAAEASPPPSVINSFRGEYNFLSNFFHSPITCDGLEFPTVEHAFQAAKCLDHENKLRILECKSPTIAKRVGLTVPLRPDWERVKVSELILLKIIFACVC